MIRLMGLFIGSLLLTTLILQSNLPTFFSNSARYQTPAAASAAIEYTKNDIDEQIASMSIDEKIGQLFIVGHWKEDNYHHMSNLIRAYHLGGVILMGMDEQYIDDVPTWVTAWQSESDIPLLISTDQEGGAVSRFRSEDFDLTPQPDITDSTAALAIAHERGQELSSLGVNTNLAPVLERSVDPFAFLYDRTFRDPEKISALGRAMIVGMREEGVVAVPKHFPGHEDTPVDSHVTLPVLNVDETTFTSHVADFQTVIDVTAPEAIMTAHVLIPAIDPQYPATLSHTILTDKLRREIGFSGVIITDDMAMGAITNDYAPEEAALMAFVAGADMILFAAKPNDIIATTARFTQAVADGTISESRLNESLKRILKMKKVY